MQKTGFGEGLFEGEELNSKSYEDKDSKLKFLVKLITLTEMMIGEKQEIKPSMVLAGQQADKTNIWLQNIFRAATAGVDSAPYVQQIMGAGDEGPEAEEDDGAEEAAAEEQAKAEANARAQQDAEEKKAKEDKKRRHEDKKRRQEQADEEERQRLEYEKQEQERMMLEQMEHQRQMEMQQEQQRAQIIRDDDDQAQEEEEDPRQHQMMEMHEDEGRGGALVEEAKRIMQEDAEGDQKDEAAADNAGPKIKMGRLGRKKTTKEGAAQSK